MTDKKSEVIDRELAINAYSTDASGISNNPISVFTPTTDEELRKIVHENHNITIRGGGSGVVGGCVPSEGSVVVDLSKMDKILDVDINKKVVYVQAGIILNDLNQELSKYNLEFPINPQSGSICTIGGMIATNATGPRSAKYKRVADHVLEIEIIDGHSKVVKLGRIDASNVVGMEGITGIIYSAKLKVIDKPKRSLTVYRSADLLKIIDLSRTLKMDNQVSMIHLISPMLSEILGLSRINHLFIEFESDRGDIKGDIYNNKIRIIDDLYKNASLSGYVRVEDPRVFLDRLIEVANYLDSQKIPYHANLGIGLVNPLFSANDFSAINDLRLFVKKIRGNIAGTFGFGKTKKNFMDINDKKLAQRIKKRYDPNNKLNRGVIVDLDEKLGLPTKESIAEIIKKIDEEEEKKEEEIINKVISGEEIKNG
ncbi:MAG: FAD-binding oxidoreductase [Nanoarchaeota archaeon]